MAVTETPHSALHICQSFAQRAMAVITILIRNRINL